MKILSEEEITPSLSVYYPSLEPLYPTPPKIEHVTALVLGFDFLVIPASHLCEFERAKSVSTALQCYFKNSVAVCSIRSQQRTLEDFFHEKISEPGASEKIFQNTIDRYGEFTSVGFNRNTESQSAAFKAGLRSELRREVLSELDTRFPREGIHQIHREAFDDMLKEPRWATIRMEVEDAKRKAYFHAGANGNVSYLFDPAHACPQNRSSMTVEAVFSFIEVLLNKKGIDLKNLSRIPADVISAIPKTDECVRFRNALLSAIKSVEASPSFQLDLLKAKEKKRAKYRALGYWLAALCISAVGLVDLYTGIISLIAGSFALPAIQKVVRSIENIGEPLLAFAEKVESVYYKELISQ